MAHKYNNSENPRPSKTLLSESFNHFCKTLGFNHFCNFVKIIFSIADNTCKHMIMTGQIIFVLLKSFLA